jgi:pyruvate/2-oxoacid:ferredoxin oxidoreductase alpha subunit
MRLFEFANDDPLRVKLMAVANQLKSKMDRPLPLDLFIEILQHNDIVVDESDIYDLIKKEPLRNIVKDIEDHNVVFKGQHIPGAEPTPDENEKIRQQMASKQTAKLA